MTTSARRSTIIDGPSPLPLEESTPNVVKFAKKGQFAKLVDLLNRGDEVNSVDKHGRSALFCAALNGHKKCLKELLRRGANPNQRNINGQTPCHAAVLGGRPPHLPEGIATTRNPVTGTCRLAVGCYNYLSYHLHDARTQCKCLQHLLKFGGDLNAKAENGETPRDIAVRMRKMELLEMIEFYFELQLQACTSGGNLSSCLSKLRHDASYPNSYPHWMQAVTKSAATFENTSPLSSKASLFYKGRCRGIFDYGFLFPMGRRTSPGAFGAVPEILPSEVLKTCTKLQTRSIDGSVWSRATWSGSVAVTLRQLDPHQQPADTTPPIMTVENLMKEMDYLCVLRHPNITLLMAVCCGPVKSDMFLALEPLQPGSLHQQLHREQRVFSLTEISRTMAGVASAVSYLHSVKGVTHNIISSHAVYFTRTGIAKLSNVFCCHAPSTALPGELSSTLRLYLPWVAPELMHTRTPEFASDVYSLGVLLWEIWGGEKPWPGLSPPELGRVLVKEGQRLIISRKHQEIAPILKCCFCAPLGRLRVEQFQSQVAYLQQTPPVQERKKSVTLVL